jgi:hypothetical protein
MTIRSRQRSASLRVVTSAAAFAPHTLNAGPMARKAKAAEAENQVDIERTRVVVGNASARQRPRGSVTALIVERANRWRPGYQAEAAHLSIRASDSGSRPIGLESGGWRLTTPRTT